MNPTTKDRDKHPYAWITLKDNKGNKESFPKDVKYDRKLLTYGRVDVVPKVESHAPPPPTAYEGQHRRNGKQHGLSPQQAKAELAKDWANGNIPGNALEVKTFPTTPYRPIICMAEHGDSCIPSVVGMTSSKVILLVVAECMELRSRV